MNSLQSGHEKLTPSQKTALCDFCGQVMIEMPLGSEKAALAF